MFLGWYDPDKKKPARVKLLEACARYSERFGVEAESCLTSVMDADAVAGQDTGDIIVTGKDFIPRCTYYIGVEDHS